MAEAEQPKETPAWRKFGRLDAHHRFFFSVAVAAVCCALLPHHISWAGRILGTWTAFVYTTLGLIWTVILTAEPREVVNTAQLQDTGRSAIFFLVLLGACAAVCVVPLELATAKGLGSGHAGAHVLFAVLTVFSSWFLVHTVFTLRYAHIYYGNDENNQTRGGLSFQDETEPDYLDFAYFSFVIGMCSQVSDVTISSSGLRRLALLHSLISFGFNVAIIGLSINTISGLLQ